MLSKLSITPRVQFVLVTAFALVVMFSKLEGSGLANWDDCYYAQKAKEILATGDWFTMHYNHAPELDNPPFFIWLIALSFKLFGVSEYTACLPSALMGVATVALVFAFGRKLYSTWAGTFAAFVLATTTPFVKYARHAMMDVTLSFFVVLALLSLVLAVRENRRPFFLLWGACIAICVLIKSVLGFFPLAITVVYLLMAGRWRTFVDPWFFGGTIVALALGCSWYVHQYVTFGTTFLKVHFGWLILQRGFTLGPKPWYSHFGYFRDIARYYWPWLPLLLVGMVQGARRAWKRDEGSLLLILWVVIIIGVMSVMRSQVLWYIMPAFPAAALICGASLDSFLSEPVKVRIVRFGVVLTVVVAAVINLLPVELGKERETDVRVLAPYVRHFASQGSRVIGYKFESHEVNNALLFYSDHAAYPIAMRLEDLAQALSDSSRVFCVLSTAELDSVTRAIPSVTVVRRVERLALIASRPVDASGVVTWKER
jgi:4-amino-4-deoxy-L-arabinose transferase-like glycosyltransferase